MTRPRVDWQTAVLYSALTALHVFVIALPVAIFWWWF